MAKVIVLVMPKQDILDPQGEAVAKALHTLGFGEVTSCRIGKVIEVEIEKDPEGAMLRTQEMAEALLANPVTEDFVVVREVIPFRGR